MIDSTSTAVSTTRANAGSAALAAARGMAVTLDQQSELEENPALEPIAPDPETVPTIDDPQMDSAGAGRWNVSAMRRMVNDCDDQPNWRVRADLACAYVDGKQFTPEQEAAAREEGLGDVRPTNLVGRVIRSICGQEAKSRTDVKVEADDDETSDVADYSNAKIKEAQRETYADMAVSQAYFGQVAPGVGWVEVARNHDPRKYRYRVQEVHRSQMWWDWRATDLFLLQDARWIVRKRWQDLDELEAAMPQKREILRWVCNGWNGFAFDDTMDEASIVGRAFRDESRWSNYQRRSEWFDGTRKRVKLYEVWYRVPAWGVFLHISPTRSVLFDHRNQAHIEAVARRVVPVSKQLTSQVRMALFAGPHRLQDIGTTRKNFPYVPFFGYRDDEDLSPYGLVEGMIAPQDEYNARRLRINWMLRARQITMDSDALDLKANTLKQVAAAVMRPNRVIVLNPNRTNKDANSFRIDQDSQLQAEQVTVMQDAKQLVQDVPGVYGSQLGQAQSGVTSGIANSLLIEQGAVAMGDLNDNYRHSRRMVFENLLDLIVEDHATAGLRVKIGRGSSSRVVVLNSFDPQTGRIINDMRDAPIRVGLGEVPATPAYRMQQQQQIAQIINAIAPASPQAVAVLAPSFIEATDLPDRMERADDLRRVMGMPTSGDREKAAKMEEQGRQEAARRKELEDAAVQLELKDKASKIEKTESETELNKAKTVELGYNMALAQMPSPDAALADSKREPGEPMDEDEAAIEASLAQARQAVAA